MKKEPKVHYKRDQMHFSLCGIKPHLKSDNIEKVTCVTCRRKFDQDRRSNLVDIDRIAGNKAMGGEEIMALLKRAFTDHEIMGERARGISEICHVVKHGVLNKQELTDALEKALVKTVMEI